MSEFTADDEVLISKDIDDEEDVGVEANSTSNDGNDGNSNAIDVIEKKIASMIIFDKPIDVIYCPICSMPPEYCEYSSTYDQCLPWIMENCPELIAKKDGDTGDSSDKKKKSSKDKGVGPKKKAGPGEIKVIISRVQRQKKKYVTSCIGLDTVPDLIMKDASKLFGKKFASGASIGETPDGKKEIVIQGDVYFDLPPLLMKEFKVPPTAIFLMNEDNKTMRPYA